MRPNDLAIELCSRLERNGLAGRMVSLGRIRAIEEEILGRRRAGEFDDAFYRVELAPFAYASPESLPEAKSLVILAAPQPQVRVSLSLDRRRFSVIIPPTYSYATDERGKRILEELLQPAGHRLVRASLPLKLAAVRSGLAQYGRNNITYVPGMGSFHRLTAFYTDVPCGEEDWADSQAMKPCRTCTACAEACPTGAIAADRFLLHAERCITFLNEFPGEFPEWLDPAGHNCLVGCLHCQIPCPANSRVFDWIEEGETFSEEETRLLLRGARRTDLSPDMLRKLERLSIVEYLELLPRNLGVLLKR